MGYYNFKHRLPDKVTPSDWLAGMVANVREEIAGYISVGLNRQDAISRVKQDSCAGPAVWKIIEAAPAG